jgi:hypothetical protein
MMRLPSWKAGRRAENESSSSTISATLRVALLPLCMAMPNWAFFTARTSFTPSPIMATRCPLPMSASTIRSFCRGERCARRSWRGLPSRQIHLAHPLELRSGYALDGAVQSRPLCQGRHGLRIIPRDDLDLDAEPRELGDGLAGFRRSSSAIATTASGMSEGNSGRSLLRARSSTSGITGKYHDAEAFVRPRSAPGPSEPTPGASASAGR